MNNTDKLPENDCQKMIRSEWHLIIDDLKKAGAEMVDYMKVRQPPGDKEAKAIPLLLKHAEKKFMLLIKKLFIGVLPVQTG
ncbi:MAG: hypothetical protein ACXV9T_16685 [Methylobacter sp.]